LRFGLEVGFGGTVSAPCQPHVSDYNTQAVEPPAPGRNTRAMPQSPPDLDDGFARWLDSCPEDDEPLTPDEQAALVESEADIAGGRTVSFEEIKRQIGDQARCTVRLQPGMTRLYC
jgi:hypothetical protein